MTISGLMICPRRQIEAEMDLPEGLKYVPYDDSLEEEWIRLQIQNDNFNSNEEAFQFIQNEDMNKFVFVKDSEDKLVASAGLFYGNQFGMKRLQLGKIVTEDSNVAFAMISKLVLLYDSIPSKFPIYTSVTDQQLEWIKIFAKLEFTPYLGFYEGHTDKQSQQDWAILTKKLKENSIS